MVRTVDEYACAIDTTGVVCWGDNKSRPNVSNPTQLSLARNGKGCAITDSGVECWGGGSYGESDIPPLSNPTQISAGSFHVCAIDDSGVVCWGDNNNGQTNVPPLSNPTQITAGWYHTCAIDDTGVVCWGRVNNSDDQSNVPSLSNPTQVSTYSYHTCALDDTGVICWGITSEDYGYYGQTNVPSLSNPTQVSVGYRHTCAIDDTGVVCWGKSNPYATTGVPPLENPTQISAALEFTCAKHNLGVKCWGRNDKGQTDVPDLSFPNVFNPVITSSSSFSAPENQTAIGTVIATDADGDSLTYSLSGTDIASISIHPSSGVLTFGSAPDYETKSSYLITVSVSDGMATTSQELTITITNVNEYSNHTLTLNYADNPMKPINGVEMVLTESDGTATKSSTDSDTNQITITIPNTNTYTLSGSLSQTGEDPVDLLDAIWILQHMGELRALTAEQLIAADVTGDGKVDLLDAIWILQHMGELRILDSSLVFLDAATGQPLSETAFNPEDIPNITVVRLGDVNQSFEPVKPWMQKGTDIIGKNMALSADGNTLAVVTKAANFNVFDWDGSAWIQRGLTIPVGADWKPDDNNWAQYGRNTNGNLSMTSDGNKIAINITGGFVVYTWNPESHRWGASINTETVHNVYYDYLKICDDGNRVATSKTPIEMGDCRLRDVFGEDRQHYISRIALKPITMIYKNVTIHNWTSSGWKWIRSLASNYETWDGNIDNSSSKNVHNIRCHSYTSCNTVWEGNRYVTKCSPIGYCSVETINLLDPDGNERSNESILNFSTDKVINDYDNSTVESLAAVSSDGTRAILRVFDMNNNDTNGGWQQRGSSIDEFEISSNIISSFQGTIVPNHFTLKLTKDSNNLAIGVTPNFHSGIDNDINNTFFGKVKIYNWNGSNWIQPGLEIDGISGDRAFRNIAFSEDGKTVAIGTLGRTDGIIRVYHLE
ncbi:cadherin domain-containing protein [Gammaproteobacteria bacterium]|nr:cadherin domain-containing protein [Gammaproteobacteria bacterium]